MSVLNGKVAVVTGASRGVGKGVALGLGEAGATVYITGRTVDEGKADLPGTIQQTADDVTKLGGKGIPVRCDHRNDQEVEAVFQRIASEQGHIDILVNNVWGGYENLFEKGEYTWELPFWEQPLWRWEAMFQSGVRAHFVASRFAAPLMINHRSGLIVNISYFAAQKYISNILYGASKAATDKLTADMAHELRVYNVAAVSLYPGLVRTERLLQAERFFHLGNSESPQFIGRAVAALAADPQIMQKTGQVLVAAEIARKYGFADIDARQPKPLTLEEV
ncbi:MAG: SDR family NAD(P)-dependent oxidoreductase [Deltaproteobacteria bacterium]